MSDGRIYADSGSMQGGAGDIANTGRNLDGIAQDITSSMRKLMGSWEGAGATAYQAYQTEWDNIFAEVQAALLSLGKAVALADTNYVNTDNAIAKAFNA